MSEAKIDEAGIMLALFRGDEKAALHRLRQWLPTGLPEFDGQLIPLSEVLDLQIYPFRAAGWLGWLLGLALERNRSVRCTWASPSGILALVMGGSCRLAAGGMLARGLLAAGVLRLLLWWSAKVSVLVWDNIALVTGVGIAGAVALLAALGPARRAARVDPNAVLRTD